MQVRKHENQGADSLNPSLNLKAENQACQCPRAGEDGRLSSSRESEFALPLPFCSIQALSGLGGVTCLGQGDGDLSFSVYRFKCYSLLETPSQTHLGIVSWLSGHSLSPARLTHNIRLHSGTEKFST